MQGDNKKALCIVAERFKALYLNDNEGVKIVKWNSER